MGMWCREIKEYERWPYLHGSHAIMELHVRGEWKGMDGCEMYGGNGDGR